MGDYDVVAIYEAPDHAVAARFNLQLGMLGYVRMLKAFPEAAYRSLPTGVLTKSHGLSRPGLARISFRAIESFRPRSRMAK
jgi:GYD domain